MFSRPLALTMFSSIIATTCLATTLNLKIEIIPPSPPAATVPPQAASQGYTTLAFDGDMTKGFDISCDNPSTTGPHQWYLGGNRTMGASCKALTYPHIDESDGSKVLDLSWSPSNWNQTNGMFNRQGIATSDLWGNNQTSFPINAYYECTTRFNEHSISHMALWQACWMVPADKKIISGENPGIGLEFDLTEFHGGYPNSQELAGAINWNCRDTCYSTWYFGNFADKVPGYDPTKFHKYGWLLYQTTDTNLHSKAYIDDILISEGDIQLDTNPDLDERKQRNYILIHLNSGCNWDEGSSYCYNMYPENIYAGTDGTTHVVIKWGPGTYSNSFLMGISGVEGMTSPINGNWYSDCTGNCTDFGIYYPNTYAPVPFAGKWTPGTGRMNIWDDTDNALHVYIKSFKVYSCPTWQTTQCSPYNPN